MLGVHSILEKTEATEIPFLPAVVGYRLLRKELRVEDILTEIEKNIKHNGWSIRANKSQSPNKFVIEIP